MDTFSCAGNSLDFFENVKSLSTILLKTFFAYRRIYFSCILTFLPIFLVSCKSLRFSRGALTTCVVKFLYVAVSIQAGAPHSTRDNVRFAPCRWQSLLKISLSVMAGCHKRTGEWLVLVDL